MQSSPGRNREAGKFWSIGPTIFFSGEDGSSGFLEQEFAGRKSPSQGLSSNSVLSLKPARINSVSSDTTNLIRNALNEPAANEKISTIPLDPTLGKASVMEKGELNLLEELQKEEEFGFIQFCFLLFFL